MTVETDTVLSAIRRGEDSLPKLRVATGLEYAQLHVVLHELEFEWRSIHHEETPEGFSRFVPMPSEKSNGNSKGAEQTTPIASPQAYTRTKASVRACNLTLVQRDAPYCVGCHGHCFFDGLTPEGRVHWRCRPCGVVFDGSSEPIVNREPEPEPEIVMRERVPLGPEEEQALDDMREGVGRPDLGDEEEETLAAMRGGELAEDEARIAEEIDQELTEVEDEAPELCGCGRDAKHNGRCAFRRAKYEHKAAKSANNGRPRKSKKNITSSITKRYGPFCEANCVPEGIGHHKDCAYWKEEEARRTAIARNAALNDEPKTSNGDGGTFEKTPSNFADAKPLTTQELPSKVADSTQIMQKIIPPTAQVQVMGGMRLHEDTEVRISEMRDWPADRISEFFDALSKVIEIPQRPLMPTQIKRAWSLDFEGEAGKDDSTVGLTYLYLISMLHHHMEPHEKEAVWTLVQYLKRLEAYVEQEKV